MNRECKKQKPEKGKGKIMNKYKNNVFKTTASVLALAAVANLSSTAAAQDSQPDEVIATGIIQSLENALVEKRQANNLVEVIKAEDIGKLPDQNLAEVLENITGIQITRTAGVGSGVQIRGTDFNRTEINGVSSVGSGFGRTGISFQDIPASLVSSLTVTKVPEAKTVEGSVGGTINLETLRPLDFKEPIKAFRAQVEQSDLADSVTPRFSGTIGNNWTNAKGQELGLVFSGSYAKQDVAFFNPRADRDNVTSANDPNFNSSTDFDYLRIQFFQQNYDNFEFDTLNLNGTLEYAPNENMRFYVDGIYNDQERTQESYVLDLSGVSNGDVVSNTNYTGFETVDFGEIDGPNGPVNLGSVQAALTGVLTPGIDSRGRQDPNFRVSTSTGARITESAVFATGLDFEKDRLSGKIEVSTASSETDSPQFRPRLEFINPNAPQPTSASPDNGVPVQFDLSNDTLQFGFAQGLDTSPTTAQLLDPANYQLGRVTFSNSEADNRETGARLDLSYDMEDSLSFLTSVDAGYRYNETTSERSSATSSVNYGSFLNRPRASQFSQFVIAGPDNFDAADGRDLFIQNYLAVDPEVSFSDPQAVAAAINDAVRANNANPNLGTTRTLPELGAPTESANAFFNISEQTHALYAQANFDGSASNIPVRGNLGVRWVDTTITSTGNTVTQGNVNQTETSASYDFFLPRFNVVANATDDLLIRGGVAKDIRRPGFTDLSTSVNFGTGSNSVVALGNPGLVPESVWSYDLSAEYYFTPSSLISVGVFHKERTNLFTDIQEDPPGNPAADGTLNIDVTDPCEQGGIFNPIADRNINSPIPGVGICVPFRTQSNGEGTFTQTGLELAGQFDLSSFEDRLGWASGFGFIGNYTYQKPGGSAQDFASNFRRIGGNRNIFGNLGVAEPLQQIVQPNLSRNTYNATMFYEKFGLSARARYTWRSSFSLPASVESFKAGAPLINGSRGQLNANMTYDVNDNISVGIEGINILQGDQQQYCVKNNTLLCFNGFTDRRLIAGLNVKF